METGTQVQSWWDRRHADERMLVAYFSMEFGVDERLRIYAGGLGVLAGDHLKSASDLGVPIVGVGLFYRRGYFRQLLERGRQVERYAEADPAALGLAREPVEVEVDLHGGPVVARVWRTDVGRVPLYLLDADGIEPTLYGGGQEERIGQEILLGVGGIRALAALGLEPTVFHLNEGHAAFAAVERLARGESLERVRASTVFTTHTPVPAGNEVFEEELVRERLGPLLKQAGMTWKDVLPLGRFDEDGFGMTPLALRTSASANGVSRLHGAVSRELWASLWPELAPDDVPIGHVTNGVHAPTWISPRLRALLEEVGVRPGAPPGEERWDLAAAVDDAALWDAHLALKRALARRAGLDPELLTIGFARRFATYKRAGLLFSEPARLARLPVQVVVAGKAHPADEEGKDLLATVVAWSRDAALAGRVVFLEDYDLALARLLVAGVDVWLNTPVRPLEASGTSGIKAGLNGVPNLSVLDGWWEEAFEPGIGWALEGVGAADADALYRLLEEQVVPAYRDRRADWIAIMKASISRVGAHFTSHRMVAEYAERFYLPAHRAAIPAA
jgi:starch phosphorylase